MHRRSVIWVVILTFFPAIASFQTARAAVKVFILAGQSNMEGHDQVMTFEDPDVLAAHKRAREEGKYPENDWVVRADHKEFFAGVTTRYFGTKEERDALVERDPVLLEQLRKVWGTPKAFVRD